jgi:alkylhydroperoxidase family enzyme
VSDEKIAALKEPGAGRRTDLFSADEIAVLRFTDLVTSYPGNIRPGDLDDLATHIDEDQVFDLALVVSTACFTTAANDGLQTPMPD